MSRMLLSRLAAGLALVLLTGPAHAQTVLVKPYIQPGNAPELGKADVKVLCWLTDQTPGLFTVEYAVDGRKARSAPPTRIALDFEKLQKAKKPESMKDTDPDDPPKKPSKAPVEREQHYFKYVAHLTDLPFNAEVTYRVKLGESLVREGKFRTRATADKTVRFALVGDLASGRSQQKAIAFHIAKENPEFLVALGDIVYPAGRVSQYMSVFWNTYNDVAKADPKTGAPLMASVSFYPVLGNHDVASKFPSVPDALGAYYFFHVPENGPGVGKWTTSLSSNKAANARFLAAAGSTYPALDTYSFDYGPTHILVLNSNQTKGIDQAKLRNWVEQDLKKSTARWKLVCYHSPAFSSSTQHYTNQAMRLWHPIFEACGVDLVFAGHVHNYQRTVPLTFNPPTLKQDKRGRVDGRFTLDRTFDGKTNTVPHGIIHIVAGGGGASLYGPGLEKTAPLLHEKNGDNYADYTAKMVTDRHSFVILDAAPTSLTLRAVDVNGKQFDEVRLTKPEK